MRDGKEPPPKRPYVLDGTVHPRDKHTLERIFPTSRLTVKRVKNNPLYGSEPLELGFVILNRVHEIKCIQGPVNDLTELSLHISPFFPLGGFPLGLALTTRTAGNLRSMFSFLVAPENFVLIEAA